MPVNIGAEKAFLQKGELRPLGKMQEENKSINHLVQSLVDPGLGFIPFAIGAGSHVDYFLDHNDLWLEVKVSQI